MSDVLDQLRGLLSEHPEIVLAIVFGSTAKGEDRRDSDLDIAVVADPPLDSAGQQELVRRVSAQCGRPVDLVDIRTAGQPLLGQVFRGVRVLGKDEVYAQELSRHLIDQEDFNPLRRRILRERREAWIG